MPTDAINAFFLPERCVNLTPPSNWSHPVIHWLYGKLKAINVNKFKLTKIQNIKPFKSPSLTLPLRLIGWLWSGFREHDPFHAVCHWRTEFPEKHHMFREIQIYRYHGRTCLMGRTLISMFATITGMAIPYELLFQLNHEAVKKIQKAQINKDLTAESFWHSIRYGVLFPLLILLEIIMFFTVVLPLGILNGAFYLICLLVTCCTRKRFSDVFEALFNCLAPTSVSIFIFILYPPFFIMRMITDITKYILLTPYAAALALGNVMIAYLLLKQSQITLSLNLTIALYIAIVICSGLGAFTLDKYLKNSQKNKEQSNMWPGLALAIIKDHSPLKLTIEDHQNKEDALFFSLSLAKVELPIDSIKVDSIVYDQVSIIKNLQVVSFSSDKLCIRIDFENIKGEIKCSLISNDPSNITDAEKQKAKTYFHRHWVSQERMKHLRPLLKQAMIEAIKKEWVGGEVTILEKQSKDTNHAPKNNIKTSHQQKPWHLNSIVAFVSSLVILSTMAVIFMCTKLALLINLSHIWMIIPISAGTALLGSLMITGLIALPISHAVANKATPNNPLEISGFSRQSEQLINHFTIWHKLTQQDPPLTSFQTLLRTNTMLPPPSKREIKCKKRSTFSTDTTNQVTIEIISSHNSSI